MTDKEKLKLEIAARAAARHVGVNNIRMHMRNTVHGRDRRTSLEYALNSIQYERINLDRAEQAIRAALNAQPEREPGT